MNNQGIHRRSSVGGAVRAPTFFTGEVINEGELRELDCTAGSIREFALGDDAKDDENNEMLINAITPIIVARRMTKFRLLRVRVAN